MRDLSMKLVQQRARTHPQHPRTAQCRMDFCSKSHTSNIRPQWPLKVQMLDQPPAKMSRLHVVLEACTAHFACDNANRSSFDMACTSHLRISHTSTGKHTAPHSLDLLPAQPIRKLGGSACIRSLVTLPVTLSTRNALLVRLRLLCLSPHLHSF